MLRLENFGISQGKISNTEYSTSTNNSMKGASKESLKRATISDNDKEIISQEANEKEIGKSVEKLNKFLEDEKVHVEYEVHDKLNQLMIKIIDDDTKEVIQELPPKKILDMVAKMCEMVGILMDKKA